MVCKILYSPEYIKGCDISKFGEGCEQCIPIFQSSLMLPILTVLICAIILTIITIILYYFHSNLEDSSNTSTQQMKGDYKAKHETKNKTHYN